MKSSFYNVYYLFNEQYYLFNQISHSLIQVDFELAEALMQNKIDCIPSELRTELKEYNFLISSKHNESEIIRNGNFSQRYHSKTMRITIIPTLGCNFHCWYCYESHVPSKITKEALHAITLFIQKEITKKQLKELVLDWFGGEPLLQFDQAIYPLSRSILDWTINNNVQFSNIITTNGVLLDKKRIDRIKQIHLSDFQITLDGGKEAHNLTRYSKSIKDSFSIIINNIHLLCYGVPDVVVTLRINYTPDNIDTIEQIFPLFDVKIRNQILISLHIVWQKSNEILALSTKVMALYEMARNSGYQIREQAFSFNCTNCYTENMEQFVVNYDLNVYKCTARDFIPQNSIGKINPDGTFIPSENFYNYYKEQSPILDEKCMACDLLPSCLNSASCIQKKLEGSPMVCYYDQVKSGVYSYIKSLIRSEAKQKILLFLFLFINVIPIIAQTDSLQNLRLDEVKVIANRIKVQQNGDIEILLLNNPIIKTRSAYEILGMVSGLQVTDDKISLLGKEGVAIYVENHKADIKEVQSLDGSLIKKIKVVHHPSLRYGDDARNGIVFITLNAEPGIMGSTTAVLERDKCQIVSEQLKSSITYQNGKDSFYHNFLLANGNYVSNYNYSGYINFSPSTSEVHNREVVVNNILSYKHTFNQRCYINTYGTWLFNNSRNTLLSAGNQNGLNKLTKIEQPSYNLGTECRLGFSPHDNYLLFNAEYNGNASRPLHEYSSEEWTVRENLRQKFDHYNIEPKIHLGSLLHGELEAGVSYVKISDKNIKICSKEGVLEGVQDAQYNIIGKERRFFSQYSVLFGSKAFLSMGVSYYSGEIKYQDKYNLMETSNSFRGLYPSAQIQYLFDEEKGSGVSLSYAKSYSLPSYGYYSPDAIYASRGLYSKGNFNLQDEKLDDIDLVFYINQSWILSINNHWKGEGIELVSYKNENGVYTIPQNISKEYRVMVDLSFSKSIGVWNTSNKINSRYVQSSTMKKDAIKGIQFVFNSSNQIKIGENAGLIFDIYASSQRKKLTSTVHHFYSLDIGGYLTLFEDKLNVRIQLNDLIHNNKRTTFFGENVSYIKEDISRRFRGLLSIGWNFRSGKSIKDKIIKGGKDIQKVLPII